MIGRHRDGDQRYIEFKRRSQVSLLAARSGLPIGIRGLLLLKLALGELCVKGLRAAEEQDVRFGCCGVYVSQYCLWHSLSATDIP